MNEHFDLTDEFFLNFNTQDSSLKKKVGLYVIESINNACIIIFEVNPKSVSNTLKIKVSINLLN